MARHGSRADVPLNDRVPFGHQADNADANPLGDHHMLRRSISSAFWALFLLGGCTGIDGNGQPASETRDLSDFVAVENDGELDVRVEQGETFSVRVDIDSNLVRAVETRVDGNTLRIDSDGNLDDFLPGPHLTVIMPHFASAALSGSGRITLVSIKETRPVSLRLSGSGNIDFQGEAPAMDVHVDGSGDVGLVGSTERIVLDLGGSGSIDATALPATSGSIEVDGSGEVRATINGPVDVDLSGSGSIDVYGTPTIARYSKSGSGEIRVH
jgi:hypothetical protein